MKLRVNRSPVVLSVCAILLGVAGSAWAVIPDAKPDAAKTPFAIALTGAWSQIDTNGDETISPEEIDAAMTNPVIKGDTAAAVASLKQAVRAKGDQLPKLTKTYFAEYNTKAVASGAVKPKESAEAAADATTDPDRQEAPATRSTAVNWDRNFAASKARIARGAGEQWRAGRFDLTNAKQGPIGDCFFVASISSMVVRDAERVSKLVTPLPTGGYRATFPDGQSFTFPAPTEPQMALSGTTAENGAWLAVMEQAYGRYRSVTKGGSTEIDGTDTIRKGGDSSNVIQALTGHKTKRISFPKTAEERAEKKDQILPELRAAIIENIKECRLITVGTLPAKKPAVGTLPKIPPGIVTNHVYTLIGYDPQTDMVELWNPHGNTYNPKGEPGLQYGFKTEKGRFKLKLEEAYSYHSAFTFETGEPVAK